KCCCCLLFQGEDGIRDWSVTGVQPCALPILAGQSVAAEHVSIVSLDDRAPEGAAGYTHLLLDRREHARLARLRSELIGLLAGERSEERRVGKRGRFCGLVVRLKDVGSEAGNK